MMMKKMFIAASVALLFWCFSCAGQGNIKQAEALPDLWLLAVGINRYENLNSRANLRYAVLNIRGIVNSFKAQEGKVYGKVHQFIITDGGDAMPSYNSIIYNLGFLGQAKPDDIVLFFFSGHGEINDDGIFCLLPSNAGFAQNGGADFTNAIPVSALKTCLDIPSRKVIILDSCYSGAAIRTLASPDTIIFTSSREDEQSLEGGRALRSIFSFSFAEGLSGKAVEDGVITAESLDRYTSDMVPQISREIIESKQRQAEYDPEIIIPHEQHPVVYIPDTMKGFVLGIR
jgi:uncharacterized caspase-like protein